MEKILLISGRKQHGKDTVALLIRYLVLKDRVRSLSKDKKIILRLVSDNLEYIHQIIQSDCDAYNQRSIKNPTYIFGQQTITRLINNTLDLVGSGHWLQAQFGAPLKEIVCSLTGCQLNKLEDDAFKQSVSLIKNSKGEYFTYRELLQYVGTELFRNQINPNIWAESYYSNRCKKIYSDVDNVTIISDWRFPNEQIYLKEQKDLEVISIKVVNPHIFTLPNEHISEKALDSYQDRDFDYIISNYSDLNALIFQIKAMLIKSNIITHN